MRKSSFFFLITIFIIILILFNLVSFKQLAAQTSETSSVSFEVGEEEYVFGPNGAYPDIHFTTIKTKDGLQGFNGGLGCAYRFKGQTLETLTYDGSINGLCKDPSGSFDDCGVWLGPVYQVDNNHWIAWYHAEKCTPSTPGIYDTRHSVAYAESFDGGQTWTKKGQVITADSRFLDDHNKDDTGVPWVIKKGDYFYMLYWDTSDWKTRLARSSVSDLGKPDTWHKYYEGNYSEPGIGGKSTGIDNIGYPFAVYNTYINRYIAPFVSGRYGFLISLSDDNDLTKWEFYPPYQTIYPHVSNYNDERVDDWFRTFGKDAKQVYNYPSFIAPDGNSNETDREFYLYYMKIFDGEGHESKYLMRRKITLYKTNWSEEHMAKVVLVRYKQKDSGKTKVSTEITKPSEGYQKESVLGYLGTSEKPGFKSLYECYIPSWQDYFVSTTDPSVREWKHCESDGDVFSRRIGWISETQTSSTKVPLYRCFNEQNLDHFLSIDTSCENHKNEGLLGFIYQEGSPALSPTPTPTYVTTPTPTQTITLTPTPTSPLPTPTPPCLAERNQGDYDCNGKVEEGDFTSWMADHLKGKTTLSFFEYWRRAFYR